MTKVNNSPDYAGWDKEEAMADIQSRVRKYEEQYETIDDDTLSYIKIYNLSSKMLVNHIYGRMAKSIVGSNSKAFRDALFGFMKEECLEFMRRRKEAFAPAMNTGTSINGMMNSFSRDDDSDGNWSHEYVGTDGMTPLPFPCHIMTSTMPRARQTVDWVEYPYPVEMLSNLNPLDKGDFMGMELEGEVKLITCVDYHTNQNAHCNAFNCQN